MTTHYAQMSYTSFDAAGSAGGWRVKQSVGDLADPEQTLLLSGVHTGLNPVKPIPPYPTLEQLQQIPRRLAYRRVNRDNACYWHTVRAGVDHTGRPGNVFIHALLDRAAGEPDARSRHEGQDGDHERPNPQYRLADAQENATAARAHDLGDRANCANARPMGGKAQHKRQRDCKNECSHLGPERIPLSFGPPRCRSGTNRKRALANKGQ